MYVVLTKLRKIKRIKQTRSQNDKTKFENQTINIFEFENKNQ